MALAAGRTRLDRHPELARQRPRGDALRHSASELFFVLVSQSGPQVVAAGRVEEAHGERRVEVGLSCCALRSQLWGVGADHSRGLVADDRATSRMEDIGAAAHGRNEMASLAERCEDIIREYSSQGIGRDLSRHDERKTTANVRRHGSFGGGTTSTSSGPMPQSTRTPISRTALLLVHSASPIPSRIAWRRGASRRGTSLCTWTTLAAASDARM